MFVFEIIPLSNRREESISAPLSLMIILFTLSMLSYLEKIHLNSTLKSLIAISRAIIKFSKLKYLKVIMMDLLVNYLLFYFFIELRCFRFEIVIFKV